LQKLFGYLNAQCITTTVGRGCSNFLSSDIAPEGEATELY
jgi:hypothetical protein